MLIDPKISSNFYLFLFYWPPNSSKNDLTLVPRPLEQQNNSWYILAGRRDGDLPDANEVIRVTSEQRLTISGPSHRQALGRSSSAGRSSGDLGAELLNHVLAFQVPDLDAGAGSGAQPVAVGREAQGVNCVGMVQGVQVLAVVEVPKHGFGVLAAGGAEGAVGGHGDGVQVATVSDVVGLELAVGQVPYLENRWKIVIHVKYLDVQSPG